MSTTVRRYQTRSQTKDLSPFCHGLAAGSHRDLQRAEKERRALDRLFQTRDLSAAEFYAKGCALLGEIAYGRSLGEVPELVPADPVGRVLEAWPVFSSGEARGPAPTYLSEGIRLWTEDFGEEFESGTEEVRRALDPERLEALFRRALRLKLLPATLRELLQDEGAAQKWLEGLPKKADCTHYEAEMLYGALAHMRLSFPVVTPPFLEDELLLDALSWQSESEDEEVSEPEEEEEETDANESEGSYASADEAVTDSDEECN